METDDRIGGALVRRLVIPDVLRGVAVVAMLIAHAAPFFPRPPIPVAFLVGSINDVASPLFALVMGVSAQLSWIASPRAVATLLQQALRGVLLILLGIWMMSWGSWVAIVLAYLGGLLLVGVPLLRLRTGWLVGVTVFAALVSDPFNALIRTQAWILQANLGIRFLADLVALGPSYRITNLLPFFLLGGLLARHGLRRDRVMWTMVVVAPFAYLARPLAERIVGHDLPGSGSYLDTLHDVGLVFLVYAIVVLAATQSRPRMAALLFPPLRVWGQLALSLYLFHVAIIAAWVHIRGGRPQDAEPAGWSATVLLPLLVAWAWARWIGTGPVEWLLGRATGRPKPLRDRKRATPVGEGVGPEASTSAG